ncbi:MAG: hypothetical protein P8Y22_04350 [Sulfurimonas sp.]
MQKIILGVIGVVVALVAIVIFSHINNIPTLDENVKAKFSQVDNQYKRRADLVPSADSSNRGKSKSRADEFNSSDVKRSKSVCTV